MPWSIDELETWIGRPVVDADDGKLGTIADVYMDDSTGNPEWLAVVVAGLFTKHLRFVPLAGAVESGNDVRVAYKKSLIKDSPSLELDGDLSAGEEEALYSHYGLAVPSSEATDRDADIAEMQESGSGSVNNEMSPEMARRRLRKRDEASIDFIELEADEDGPRSDAGQ